MTWSSAPDLHGSTRNTCARSWTWCASEAHWSATGCSKGAGSPTAPPATRRASPGARWLARCGRRRRCCRPYCRSGPGCWWPRSAPDPRQTTLPVGLRAPTRSRASPSPARGARGGPFSDDGAGALPEDRHTTGAHVVVLAVGRGVDPDPRPRRDDHVLVQDGPPDVGALPDVHAVHQDAVLHPGTALDPHARRD